LEIYKEDVGQGFSLVNNEQKIVKGQKSPLLPLYKSGKIGGLKRQRERGEEG